LSVFDLSGATPAQADYSVPVAYLSAFAAASPANWIVSNVHGVLIDGASPSATPRYPASGQAWSIAGSSGGAATSIASGKILLLDPATPAIQLTIDFPSSKLALSADGTVLGAMANSTDAQYAPDRTLNFYSLPSGGVIRSYPYTFQDGQPNLFDFMLAGSGATISQTKGTFLSGRWTYARSVTPLSGSPVIWSDSALPGPGAPPVVLPILLSPDGTLAAVFGGGTDKTVSIANVVKNGTLVTAVPGAAIGCIDNTRLLINRYLYTGYGSAGIYDATGAKLSAPALPELTSIQTVTPDLVYDPSHNVIYSLTTGQPTWTGSLPGGGVGAIAGSYVVYASRSRIVAEELRDQGRETRDQARTGGKTYTCPQRSLSISPGRSVRELHEWGRFACSSVCIGISRP
jgi:hypothetical protein